MARKQAIVKETAAAAAPRAARAAKPRAPRVKTAQHSKSVSLESTTVQASTEHDTEVIAKIAYGYWESRGGHGGSALEDWVRAEREYVNRFAERASA